MGMLIAMTEPADLLFERAFARHWEDVFRFVLALTNDWGTAEDLTQEAFSRLWQSRLTIDWERPKCSPGCSWSRDA